MIGNGVVGIISESTNKWERRAPLTPSHCARLLHASDGTGNSGVTRITLQFSTKRIHHNALYEDVGCEISEDLSECGLILGIKQPKLEMILPNKAYAFFSHTHKAQKENMPLLDKILAEKASLFDYELIVGDHGKRLLAFGKFAGRAGLIDFLHGLGKRYVSLGYSTPFRSLGESYMYPFLAAAKAAVISLGEEIAMQGLPSGICPLVFGGDLTQNTSTSKRVYQVNGCVVTCRDMVEPKDSARTFDKADYYAHAEHYNPIFHEKIAPYASVIVNYMYWEKRFPRLLSIKQIQEYDPLSDSYHDDMEGKGVICLAVVILPTEFAKEASKHFGDILSQFVGNLASTNNLSELPSPLKRACIAHGGALTSLYEYIPRMRKSDLE
ncbi:hypothetical protein MKX01_041310 [Papaver californicum]|nr:hypothetical protein MKX01_041310 [Papaver californicum]